MSKPSKKQAQAAKLHPGGLVRGPVYPLPDGVANQLRLTQMQMQWTGPIPPPDALRKFNEVLPGATERVMALAEREAEHRHQRERHMLDTEREAMREEVTIIKRGQWFGFSIGIAGLIAACVIPSLCPSTGGYIVSGLLDAVSEPIRRPLYVS